MPQFTPVPRVTQTLKKGFNLIASNAKLLLLPCILDLFLLFGPRLRISKYFMPMLDAAYKQMITQFSGAAVSQMELAIDLIASYLESVNLFGAIQISPIGVNLLNMSGGSQTPLGTAISIQLTSLFEIIPILIMVVGMGLLLGVLYYSTVAGAVAQNNGTSRAKQFGKQLLNTVIFYIAFIILVMVLAIPISCIMSVTMLISTFLYQIITFLLIAACCWLIVPLYYIPHGIFVKNLELTQAVKESVHLAFWSGSITVRFILLSLIISLGLDLIWTIPAENSWLILFSIFGHAFISTAILAASFTLYAELDRWQQLNYEFLDWRKANLRTRKFFNKKGNEKHD